MNKNHPTCKDCGNLLLLVNGGIDCAMCPCQVIDKSLKLIPAVSNATSDILKKECQDRRYFIACKTEGCKNTPDKEVGYCLPCATKTPSQKEDIYKIIKKRDFCPCNHHFFITDVTPVEEPLCEDGNFCPYCTEIKRLLDTIFSYEVRFDTNADDVDDELELDEYDEDMDADELLDLGEGY